MMIVNLVSETDSAGKSLYDDIYLSITQPFRSRMNWADCLASRPSPTWANAITACGLARSEQDGDPRPQHRRRGRAISEQNLQWRQGRSARSRLPKGKSSS